jgi:DNA-binding PadR family transcriptional regulator
MRELERFGLEPALLDPGLVYRSLRRMELAGWVVSEWDTSGVGPARRVYTLTAEGRQALALWREELDRTHDILHKVLGDEDKNPGQPDAQAAGATEGGEKNAKG